MPNKLSIKSLLENFPPASKEDWLRIALMETQLSTIDKLAWKGTNELFFQPYYDKQDRDKLRIKNNFELDPANENFHGARSWFNQPPVLVKSESLANLEALNHLQHGADGILFECPENVDFRILLNNIQLEFCHVHFVLSHISSWERLLNYFNEHLTSIEKIQGGILWKKKPADIVAIVNDSIALKKFLSLGIWTESNTDPIEEIIETLLAGVALVDHLTDKGFDPHEIFSSIFFSLETGREFFFTIAKIKALRILWYQIIRSYGADYPYHNIHIHCRCEPFANEKYEPHANMLKSPLAGLAATIGGCQGLSIYPQVQSSITERVARNVSSILREESHVDAVADPLAGSYFVDTLVNSLAQHAWAKFTDKVNLQ